MLNEADAMRNVGTSSQPSRPPANPVWCGPQVHAYEDLAVAVLPQAEAADQLMAEPEPRNPAELVLATDCPALADARPRARPARTRRRRSAAAARPWSAGCSELGVM
jgi:hypothetical protein